MQKSLQKKLAAIMFTDIVGYTTMMGQDEAKTLQLLRKSRAIHLEQIEKYNGRVIKEMGDGMLAQFNDPLEAILCARDIQLEARLLLCKIRIGIDFGEVTVENGDVFGNGVNIASRLQSIAEPGGVFISENVHTSIENEGGISCEFLGELRLKNVKTPLKTFALAGPGLPKTSRQRKKELTGSESIESIAILPFQSLSGDPEQQFFVDGMHDALITELSQINSLQVISRTSTLRYRNTTQSIMEIAHELGVDALVEATVLKNINKVRIQVQLIKAISKEDHLWAKSYNRELKDVLSMYNEVVKDITREIDAKLTESEAENLDEFYEVNPEAYELYLKGVYYWEKLSRESLKRSLDCFTESTEKDPNFAPAYNGMAGVWLGRLQMGLIQKKDAMPHIYQNVYRSLDLDDENAHCYFWRGCLKVFTDWEWDKGYKNFLKARDINPNFAMNRAYFAQLLAIMNLTDDAVSEMETALRLDPFNALLQSLYGMVLNYARKFASAEAILLQVLDENENHPIALSTLRSVYYNLGQFDRSYEIFKRSYLEKGESHIADILQEAYEKGGYSSALSEVAHYKSESSDGTYHTPWQIGTLYARAGNKDRAIEYLQKAYEVRDPNMPYLGVDPIFDKLRDHPGYLNMLKKMNLIQFFNTKQYENH